MSPFFVADVIVKNPCAGIDPDSWAWILKGCWIIGREETVLVVGLCITGALLLAAWWQSVNQKWAAA